MRHSGSNKSKGHCLVGSPHSERRTNAKIERFPADEIVNQNNLPVSLGKLVSVYPVKYNSGAYADRKVVKQHFSEVSETLQQRNSRNFPGADLLERVPHSFYPRAWDIDNRDGLISSFVEDKESKEYFLVLITNPSSLAEEYKQMIYRRKMNFAQLLESAEWKNFCDMCQAIADRHAYHLLGEKGPFTPAKATLDLLELPDPHIFSRIYPVASFHLPISSIKFHQRDQTAEVYTDYTPQTTDNRFYNLGLSGESVWFKGVTKGAAPAFPGSRVGKPLGFLKNDGHVVVSRFSEQQPEKATAIQNLLNRTELSGTNKTLVDQVTPMTLSVVLQPLCVVIVS